jgi:Na+-transporting NADH:ubiquinone oxidoreductase subunit A
MSQTINIKKGATIKLKGAAEKVTATVALPDSFSINPADFHGVTPKLAVKAGDEVKAGSVLFYDKNNEVVKFTSPVSGKVEEIVRGEKRKILSIRITADKETKYESFAAADPNSLDSAKVKDALLNSGLWTLIKQRPYDVIALPQKAPKAIVISGFDTSPLAPNLDYILHEEGEAFQAGLDALAKLTEGKVHLNLDGKGTSTKVLSDSKNVQINKFSGPHPAGNTGVQIHHLDPINKGETVYTVNAQDVMIIGRFFKSGKVNLERTIAVCGSQVAKPKYYKAMPGGAVKNLIADNIIEGDENRFISGNPLTGTQIATDGYLGYYDNSITVLPEGNDYDFLGWLLPNPKKLSFSRTFLSWLTPNKEYKLNTNLNGEQRAFVVTGQYESMIPMDIYPVHLIKAVMINDIDAMESLGIYEVAPEDFALAEFSCTSKTNVQQIIRQGLDSLKQEVE